MCPDEIQKEIAWLKHADLRSYLASQDIPHPWFPAFKAIEKEGDEGRFFSAFVSPSAIPQLVQKEGWDVGPKCGYPSIWDQYIDGAKHHRSYHPFGNDLSVEPLVIWRGFHGLKEPFLELAQEFRLFHNLYPDLARQRYLHIDEHGDESEAVRFGRDYLEVKTALLRRFCSAKQVALAVYVESFRYSSASLQELGITDYSEDERGEFFYFPLTVGDYDATFGDDYKTRGLVIGAKKYILPESELAYDQPDPEIYQEFIIGTDSNNRPVRHTCDPSRLADYFGKNPGCPNYVTPVFFRPEVLSKYYAEPHKYTVQDGRLQCGALWGLRMDNDNPDHVVVWLGDLGQDLSEKERHYWLSFNIPPEGRQISTTNYKRALLGMPANPTRPDLRFKLEYQRFNEQYEELTGEPFFLDLHLDDAHFFTGLRLPATDNQAEFDSQVLALTKLLIDSLNEQMIARDLPNVKSGDKGISKLECMLKARGVHDFASHIKFLRVLQDLRSKSAAHRKGSQYDKLRVELGFADDGQKAVFGRLLASATGLIVYLRQNLVEEAEG